MANTTKSKTDLDGNQTLKGAFNDSDASLGLNGSIQYINIERLSGPSAIAASESVNLMATTAATSISTSTETVVNGTKVYDSHGAYNSTTGIFTCPIAGKYKITAALRYSSAVIGAGGVQELYVKKNSDANIPINRSHLSSSTFIVMLTGSYIFNCVAGDTLLIKAYNNTTTALDGSSSNFLEIERIGN